MSLPRVAAFDLNLLFAAEVLLSERNLSRAARRLKVTRSAMSHTLSRLRDLFGDPLLVRDGNVMTPTPRAEEILPALRDALARCEGLIVGPTVFAPERAARRFKVLASDYVSELVFPPLVAALAREAPHIDLDTFPARRDFARALGDDMDLAFVPSTDDASGLIAGRGFSDTFVCVLRRGHPDAAAFTLERFAALPHMLVAPRNLRPSQVDTAFAERSLSRRVALTLPYFATAPAVLATSDLVLTTPARLAARWAAVHPLVLVPPPLPLPGFTFRVCWHARLQDDAGHAWLRARILKVCRAVDATPAPAPSA